MSGLNDNKSELELEHTLFLTTFFLFLSLFFSSKEPSTVIPKLDNQGSNHSLLVTWDHPVGGLDLYILNISSEGWSSSKVLNSTEHNHTFSQLTAATVFTVTLTTVKATFRETSRFVKMATCEYSTPNIARKSCVRTSHDLESMHHSGP